MTLDDGWCECWDCISALGCVSQACCDSPCPTWVRDLCRAARPQPSSCQYHDSLAYWIWIKVIFHEIFHESQSFFGTFLNHKLVKFIIFYFCPSAPNLTGVTKISREPATEFVCGVQVIYLLFRVFKYGSSYWSTDFKSS